MAGIGIYREEREEGIERAGRQAPCKFLLPIFSTTSSFFSFSPPPVPAPPLPASQPQPPKAYPLPPHPPAMQKQSYVNRKVRREGIQAAIKA